MLCYIMLHYILLHYIILRYVRVCYAVLCYDILYYIIIYYNCNIMGTPTYMWSVVDPKVVMPLMTVVIH